MSLVVVYWTVLKLYPVLQNKRGHVTLTTSSLGEIYHALSVSRHGQSSLSGCHTLPCWKWMFRNHLWMDKPSSAHKQPSVQWSSLKVTIRPQFSIPIFNNVSRKKSQFSQDAHLSHFWLGVPDLSISAAVCFG